MKYPWKFIATIFIIAMVAPGVYAKFNRAEDAIRYRQAVMFLISQHFGHMGEVVRERQPYDQSAFAQESAVVETLSKMPWEAFLYPESDRGQTKLNPKALINQDDFMQAAQKMETETAKLAADAKTGDLNIIKNQFGAVALTCKNCHVKFKSR